MVKGRKSAGDTVGGVVCSSFLELGRRDGVIVPMGIMPAFVRIFFRGPSFSDSVCWVFSISMGIPCIGPRTRPSILSSSRQRACSIRSAFGAVGVIVWVAFSLWFSV